MSYHCVYVLLCRKMPNLYFESRVTLPPPTIIIISTYNYIVSINCHSNAGMNVVALENVHLMARLQIPNINITRLTSILEFKIIPSNLARNRYHMASVGSYRDG